MATYAVSDFIDPIVPPNAKGRSEFTIKALALPLNKAFVVEGMKLNNVYARANQLSKLNNIKLKVSDLKDGRVQVARIA